MLWKKIDGKNNYHFLLIGAGAEKENLLKLKNDLNLTNVTMLDPVPKSEVKRYISVLDVSLINLKTAPCVLYNTNESDEIIRQSKEEVGNADFSDSEIKLIVVGKLTKTKGVDRILKIIYRLKQEKYPVHLFVLGVGAEEANLRKYVRDHMLEKQVDFLGYQTNPYKYVTKCDLFVCGSHAEGFSTATTEALIVGTPVCTVEVSGMKEMLGYNNEFGIVTKNDDDALYQGIKRLLDDKELLLHYKIKADMLFYTFSPFNFLLIFPKTSS